MTKINVYHINFSDSFEKTIEEKKFLSMPKQIKKNTKMTEKKKRVKKNEIDEKLESILYPSTKAKKFKITLEFGYKISQDYKKAMELAKKNTTYKEEGSGEWVRHSATYTPDEVDDLFELFNLIHKWENTEVLVNHKKIPYGQQLWLPLMWFYRVK